MKVVYTAGPFTADTSWEIACNVHEMRKVALEVARRGAVPLFHGQLTPEFWYEVTLELLKRCDAIVMHPSWGTARGAVLEHEWARKVGMPIFHYSEIFGLANTGFEEWIKE